MKQRYSKSSAVLSYPVIRVCIICSLFAGAFGSNRPAGAGEQGNVTVSAAEKGWEDVCRQGPSVIKKASAAILNGKHPKTKHFRTGRGGYDYVHLLRRSGTFGGKMADFYNDGIIKIKSLPENIKLVEDIQKAAAVYHEKFKPAAAEAEKMERAMKAVWRILAEEASAKKPPKDSALKRLSTAGSYTPAKTDNNEFDFALSMLSKALHEGDITKSALWAGEAWGAAARFAEVMRWAEIEMEWAIDLCRILLDFKPVYDKWAEEIEKNPKYRWMNYMFGRLPGAQSLMYVINFDSQMIEKLYSDFLEVSAEDRSIMGTAPFSSNIFSIDPERRDAYEEILNGIPEKTRQEFSRLPETRWELGMFHAAVWRWEDEGTIDKLIHTLNKYDANYRKKSLAQIMEIIHVPQGSYGSSRTTIDRYHPRIVEWSKQLKGMAPDKAAQKACRLAHAYYKKGGYAGRLWTLHAAFKSGKTDCIRISQMVGDTYANAGYAGIHPVRIFRTSPSGHTYVNVDAGRMNFCMDALSTMVHGPSFAKKHINNKKLLAASKAYRSLSSYVTGIFICPLSSQKIVQLGIPYYGMKRDIRL